MIEILEMEEPQIQEVLGRVRYGHFACCRDNQPYIVPVNYAYSRPDLYIYTTEGLKAEIVRDNPLVCLQVEEFLDDGSWNSVIAMGEAEEILEPAEREKAVTLIRSFNPELLPALAIRWANNWIRENIEVVYRIKPTTLTGRYSLKVITTAAAAKPGSKP